MTAGAAGETLQLVTFAVAGDEYAADIAVVERVLRHVRPRAVPNAPVWLLGVIDYASRVVPVLDLRVRFELQAARAGSETRIVVFDLAGQWVGAVVDAVYEVVRVPRTAIEPPPSVVRGLTREYVTGLLRRSGRVIVVLDVPRLLTSQERLVVTAAAGATDV